MVAPPKKQNPKNLRVSKSTVDKNRFVLGHLLCPSLEDVGTLVDVLGACLVRSWHGFWLQFFIIFLDPEGQDAMT